MEQEHKFKSPSGTSLKVFLANIKREVEEQGDEDLRTFFEETSASLESLNETLKRFRRWEDPTACQQEIDRIEEEIKEYLDTHPCYEYNDSEKEAMDGIANTIGLADGIRTCFEKIEGTVKESLEMVRSCAGRYQDRVRTLERVVASQEQQAANKDSQLAIKLRGMEEGGMEVDASIEEEARETSRHGETAGAGAESQVPQRTPANQTGPVERTLTSTTPAVDEGQAPQRQHTSAWSARQALNPAAEIQWMSQFFSRKG